jgi:hypothetical protein
MLAWLSNGCELAGGSCADINSSSKVERVARRHPNMDLVLSSQVVPDV